MLAKLRLPALAVWFRRTEMGVPDKNSIAVNSHAGKVSSVIIGVHGSNSHLHWPEGK